MSAERFEELVVSLCETVGLLDSATALERRCIEVDGFEIQLGHYDNDPEAMYLNFNFGIVTTGRTLRVMQLMLESNLTVYAQDQAQLGMNPDTGGVLLIVRMPMAEDTDAESLAGTLEHYSEHGRYWRDNLVGAHDDQFNGLCDGHYSWMRA